MNTPPPDISETYTLGKTQINAFSTSGVDENAKPNGAQADAHTISYTPQVMTGARINTLMNMLHEQSFDNQQGSTGIITAISTAAPGRITISTGARGNSETLLVFIDAAGRATTVINTTNEVPGFAAHNEFGTLGSTGSNSIYEGQFALGDGKKLAVVSFSDGLTDAFYTTNLATTWQIIAQQVADEISRNGEKADVAQSLARRAHELGRSIDNISVAAAVLDSSTHINSGSIVLGVFDGAGKDDGRLSATLAQTTGALLTQDITFDSAIRKEQGHLSTRGGAQDAPLIVEKATPSSAYLRTAPAVTVTAPVARPVSRAPS